jgi:hypothetical protein
MLLLECGEGNRDDRRHRAARLGRRWLLGDHALGYRFSGLDVAEQILSDHRLDVVGLQIAGCQLPIAIKVARSRRRAALKKYRDADGCHSNQIDD